MTELKTLVEQAMDRATPSPELGDVARRRDRKRRNRRVGGGVVGGAIGIVLIAATIRVTSDDGATTRPANTPSPTASPTIEPAIPDVAVPPGGDGSGADSGHDYLLDLKTGETTPIPESIRGGLERNGYAVSPDGSEIAYIGRADDGTEQVFVAHIDGTRVRQITDDPGAHADPSWSPDGTEIAYVHTGSNVFVVDLGNGRTTQVTSEHAGVFTAQFTPDGASIIYIGSRSGADEALIVPATGGEGSRLVDVTGDAHSGASLSPDGSHLLYGCAEGGDDASLCVANADGTHPRMLVKGRSGSNVWGARWSPDGTRVAYWVFHEWGVYVIDVTTGGTTLVAMGASPTWADDHTLIVEPYSGPR